MSAVIPEQGRQGGKGGMNLNSAVAEAEATVHDGSGKRPSAFTLTARRRPAWLGTGSLPSQALRLSGTIGQYGNR